jgi:hypothetical protein
VRVRVLLTLGVPAALGAALLTAGGPAAHAATPPTPAAHAARGGRNWVPPTPAYWPQVVGQQATRPVSVTHGVQEYTENYQTVGGAQNAQIMDVDLADPNVHFGMVEAGDKLVDPSQHRCV